MKSVPSMLIHHSFSIQPVDRLTESILNVKLSVIRGSWIPFCYLYSYSRQHHEHGQTSFDTTLCSTLNM